MVALLRRQQQQQQGVEGASTSTGGGTVPAQPRVLQAYACRALFPEPGTSPDAASFQAVRSALAQQLVSHFGDAVAALSRPHLYRQLLQLPAVAVRELLAADDFGTDSEDSVFLLLAAWLEANKGEEGEDQGEAEGVSAAKRAELCGLVRLHRLSRMFLHHVLPVYEPCNISRAELGFLLRYAGAPEPDKEELLACNYQRQGSPWYCSPARRQVVPEEGRTVDWSISREDLEEGLRRMAEGKEGVCPVLASFGASAASALGNGRLCWVLSRGLLWTAAITLTPESMATTGAQGSAAAGISVLCYTPQLLGNVFGIAYDPWRPWGMQLTVHRSGGGGGREGFSEVIGMRDMSRFEPGWTRWWPSALKLGAGVTSSGSGGNDGNNGGGSGSGGKGRDAQVEAQVAAQLARWSEWMHEGKVTGRITFMK